MTLFNDLSSSKPFAVESWLLNHLLHPQIGTVTPHPAMLVFRLISCSSMHPVHHENPVMPQLSSSQVLRRTVDSGQPLSGKSHPSHGCIATTVPGTANQILTPMSFARRQYWLLNPASTPSSRYQRSLCSRSTLIWCNHYARVLGVGER